MQIGIRNSGHGSYWKGYAEIVQKLLIAGADTDKARPFGLTPLYVVAQNGHIAVVQALLAAGADRNKGCRGATLLAIAARNGHTTVDLLKGKNP